MTESMMTFQKSRSCACWLLMFFIFNHVWSLLIGSIWAIQIKVRINRLVPIGFFDA